VPRLAGTCLAGTLVVEHTILARSVGSGRVYIFANDAGRSPHDLHSFHIPSPPAGRWTVLWARFARTRAITG